ncbi:hypothetical protein [Kordia sp.]|uniref:hypothetical protein n=1 Tax=Kordia sp. TaxID=1965332 RepID=UPI003B592640
MISKKERKKLQEVFGYHYSDKVLKILKENNVTNRNGTPYGKSMIRNVYNGLNENKDIENAIWELFLLSSEKNQKREALINELLEL